MPEVCDVSYKTYYLDGHVLEVKEKACGRLVHKSGKCIFHLDDADKPIEPFVQEIARLNGRAGVDEADFSHFVFPAKPFTFPVAPRRKLLFEHCKFNGDISFKGLHFPYSVSFNHAEFKGQADFGDDGNPYTKRTEFGDTVDFTNVRFKRAIFRNCDFKKMPTFQATEFIDGGVFANARLAFRADKQRLEFRQCKFLGKTDMALGFSTKPPEEIRFTHCDMRGLEISTLAWDQVPIAFENIEAWNTGDKVHFWTRNKIIDEELWGKSDPTRIIDCYKRLEKYFYDHSDYDLARHFYAGQMIVRRNNPNYGKVSRIANGLYQMVSDFGDSILRPIASLILVWLIVPIVLLFGGMNVNKVTAAGEKIAQVNYDLSDAANRTLSLATFWSDYKSAFGANLSLSTIDRKHELSPPSDSWQKVLLILETAVNVVFLSLLVVAVRRKFTPKVPLGD